MSNPHSAADSAIGYAYQGYYAILVLLRDGDDEATIRIEADDDIQLEGTTPSLIQLKHSRRTRPPSLTVKSVDFWKTLRVWIESGDEDSRLVFVTCASIAEGDPLANLSPECEEPDIDEVLTALSFEGERVVGERESAARKGRKLPHEKRAVGAESFLALSDDERRALIMRCAVLAREPQLIDIKTELIDFFKGWVPPELREVFAEQLLQWWSYRVTRSLIGELSHPISRAEVYDRQVNIIRDLQFPSLPEEYSRRSPADPLEGLGTNMACQIDLVDGGEARKEKAALARWRARHQREKWMSRDLSLETKFSEFDDRLFDRWGELFAAATHDLRDADDVECQREGRNLLDWAQQKARLEIQPPARVQADYLVPGSFQQLADELQLGWHRDWEELLMENEE